MVTLLNEYDIPHDKLSQKSFQKLSLKAVIKGLPVKVRIGIREGNEENEGGNDGNMGNRSGNAGNHSGNVGSQGENSWNERNTGNQGGKAGNKEN